MTLETLNHHYSGTAMLSEFHKVLLVSTQSTPHLWTQGKEKQPSGLWADEQWMQTFTELNLLPSGLSGGLSRGHNVMQRWREAAGEVKMSHGCTLRYGVCVVGRWYYQMQMHTRRVHIIMCTHRPWGTVPSLSLSLATVTSSGYGPVLFDFKHCLSLVPALSCPFLSLPLCLTLCVS